MRLLTVNRALRINDELFPAGVPFLFPDAMALQLRETVFGRHIVGDEPFAPPCYRAYAGQLLDGKRLLIVRHGGLGDLLFVTPLLRHFKKRYPTAHLTFAAAAQNLAALRGNPDVDRLIAPPISRPYLDEFDYHLHFEGSMENSTDPAVHAVDLFARLAGVTLDDDNKRPVFHLQRSHQRRAKHLVHDLFGPARDRPLVAVQVAASAPIRTYPPAQLMQVLRMLSRDGAAVLLLGNQRDWTHGSDRPERVYNLCGRFGDVLDAVAVMAQCDALVAPDSAFTHFAAALDVPTVALYGPFPGAVRTKHYPRCVTLEPPREACPTGQLPCMQHGHLPCPAARRLGRRWSPCFDGIELERIVTAVREVRTTSRRT
jgi:ADP-heptose:LPS heptosyltransferase